MNFTFDPKNRLCNSQGVGSGLQQRNMKWAFHTRQHRFTQVDEEDPTLPLGRRLRLEDAFLLQKCPLNQDLSQFMHIIHP